MATNSRAQNSKITRRYWRRTDSPRPWWPWGAMPLLGLVLLFLFGAVFTAPRIEAEVRSQVYQHLGGNNVAADVSTDGQGVTVQAQAPAGDRATIQAIAKSTQCDTWAGQLTCPTSVSVHLEEPEAAPALLVSRPHQFVVVKTEDEVTLSGEVPNLEEHDRVVAIAGQQFPRVKDQLTITNEAANENYAKAADSALAVAGRLVSGQASWTNDVFSVTGLATAENLDAARSRYNALGSGSILGDFDVQAIDESLRCNDSFRELLSDSTIRFQTGSAKIDDSSEELLARIAALAHACPGTLAIEGHTDDQGDATMNQSLSLARASAVSDALAALGIRSDRLAAAGFGDTQPIADNATSDGRARNRRIAISINEEQR